MSADLPLRLLFVKDRLAWPRSSGHDVHTFYMMQALAQAGHDVGLATIAPAAPEATAGGGFAAEYSFDNANPPVPTTDTEHPVSLTKSQEKFRNYWGVDPNRIRWVAAAAEEFRADGVVVSGLNVLPYLGALPADTLKIWYAADEWVWHHLSQVRAFRRSSWSELKPAIVKGLYQRAYRPLLDRVWVVSQADARAFRWFAGIRNADVMPNGVDADYYAPGSEPTTPRSCVFWGRLDFGPNIQAIEWFCTHVWPRVRSRVPDATFQIFGFQPTPGVTRFVGTNGITLTADLPDIRTNVRSAQVVVLPFVSGGGIKNKLLEAAALGMPTIGTPRVVSGLNGNPPIPTPASPAEWERELLRLWDDATARTTAGKAARDWVTTHHTWAAAAAVASKGLELSRLAKPRGVVSV